MGRPAQRVIFDETISQQRVSRGLWRKPAGQPPPRYAAGLLYDAYLFLILIIECYFRHYSNNDQENWARTTMQELYKILE